MNFKKKKDGYYEVRVVRKVNGKPVEKRARKIATKGEARRIYKEFEDYFRMLKSEKEFYVWPDALDEYLAYYEKQVTVSTLYSARKYLEAHTLSWSKRSVQSITSEDIYQIMAISLLGRAEDTKATVLKHLRGVFNFYKRKGYINEAPTAGISFSKKKRPKLTAMSRAEITKLIQHTKEQDHPWYPIYRLVYELGLRSGEGLALKWSDVDFDQKKVVISQSYCSKGKLYKAPKNGESRTLVINESLLTFLKELRLKSTDSDFVLPQLNQWKKGRAAIILRSLQSELGITATNFHSLRASFITHLLNANVPVTKVQYLVGHADLKTTQKYVRLAASDLVGSTDSLAMDLEPAGVQVLEFKKD